MDKETKAQNLAVAESAVLSTRQALEAARRLADTEQRQRAVATIEAKLERLEATLRKHQLADGRGEPN